MEIRKLVLGELDTNCYLLEKDNNVLIIDPASDYRKIIKYLNGKNVLGIIITHYHFDHIGALDDFKKNFDITIYDSKNLKDTNCISNFNFKVIKTPGHTDDSITIYFEKEKVMFVGDFVFKGTIGRMDLPTGDSIEMKNSIEKLKKYSDIIIYPGHGEGTTIEYEKKNNYYFK